VKNSLFVFLSFCQVEKPVMKIHDSWQKQKILLFCKTFQTVFEFTQPPTYQVPGATAAGVSICNSAAIFKEEENYPPVTQTPSRPDS